MPACNHSWHVPAVKGVLITTICLAAATVAGAASAAIVPGRGIQGVNLGMTQAQVRRALGKPVSVVHGRNDLGRFTTLRFKGYSATFQPTSRLTYISTTSRRERTGRGVGVGSTYERLRRSHPRVTCDGTAPATGACWLGVWQPGRRITVFSFDKGLVERVSVGTVLD